MSILSFVILQTLRGSCRVFCFDFISSIFEALVVTFLYTIGYFHFLDSIAFSDRSASTLSDITVREVLNPTRLRNSLGSSTLPLVGGGFDPPPPYTSPHSTLVAVRTTGNSNATRVAVPRPHTPPSMSRNSRPSLSTQRSLPESSHPMDIYGTTNRYNK